MPQNRPDKYIFIQERIERAFKRAYSQLLTRHVTSFMARQNQQKTFFDKKYFKIFEKIVFVKKISILKARITLTTPNQSANPIFNRELISWAIE